MTGDIQDMKALIARVADGDTLSESEAEMAFDIIMSGNATPSQMGGFLMALRVRGETVAEITGAARTMRAAGSCAAGPVVHWPVVRQCNRGKPAAAAKTAVTTFGGGCFWCVEEVYESVEGVKESISGYAGGTVKNPTYQNHGDHAEAVEVLYNPKKVSFKTLVDVYFAGEFSRSFKF